MGVENIPKDLQKKLDKWQTQSPSYKQVRALEDIALMTQEMLGILEKSEKAETLFRKDLAPLLLDARESLNDIKNKEAPEVDNKPVIDALKAVDKTLKSIDVKPEFKPEFNPEFKPDIKVESKVDLKGVEDLLKTKIPQAFADAIAKIPETEIPDTDLQPLIAKYNEILEVLTNIDTAVRVKPEFPTRMAVTTPTNTPLETSSLAYDVLIETNSGDSNISYIGKAEPGTATSSAAWQIKEVDKTSGTHFRLADGDRNFDNVWDDRESLSY